MGDAGGGGESRMIEVCLICLLPLRGVPYMSVALKGEGGESRMREVCLICLFPLKAAY
jgi:hypothetical protein